MRTQVIKATAVFRAPLRASRRRFHMSPAVPFIHVSSRFPIWQDCTIRHDGRSRRLESLDGNGSQLLGLCMLLLLLLLLKHLRGTPSFAVVHLGLLRHGCSLVCIHLEGGWGFQGIQGLRWKEAGGILAILGRGGDLGDDRHLDRGGGRGRGGGGGGGAARVNGVMWGLFQLVLDTQRLLLLLNLAQVVGHEEITGKMDRMRRIKSHFCFLHWQKNIFTESSSILKGCFICHYLLCKYLNMQTKWDTINSLNPE